MPYYAATNGDIAALLVGILSIVVLIVLSTILINSKVKENNIKKMLFLMVFFQIIIVVIDNYITVFPLMGFDPRAFEGLAWFSYENGVNVGRGEYNYLVLNPIYKLIGVRAATVFGVVNIFANLLTNLNLYTILKRLKLERKVLNFLILISALSPISLIFRSGVLRESIIIMFISYSLKSFIEYALENNKFELIKSFIYVILGSIFHGGAIFIGAGYAISLVMGKKNQKQYQILFFILFVVVFAIFKDKLLESVGGGDIDNMVKLADIYNSLNESGSGYLRNISTDSLGRIIMYSPLLIFYFLYSPTPEMLRGVLDIATFLLNSSIFILLTIGSIKKYQSMKKNLNLKEKRIIKSLLVSFIFTTFVFSVGTRNSGTAIRHRDKVVLPIIIIYGILENRCLLKKINRKHRREEIYEKTN